MKKTAIHKLLSCVGNEKSIDSLSSVDSLSVPMSPKAYDAAVDPSDPNDPKCWKFKVARGREPRLLKANSTEVSHEPRYDTDDFSRELEFRLKLSADRSNEPDFQRKAFEDRATRELSRYDRLSQSVSYHRGVRNFFSLFCAFRFHTG